MEVIKGDFGMKACMESVIFDVETLGENPFDLLKEYKERAEKDVFFNKKMITAVEEYIRINNLVEEVEENQVEETKVENTEENTVEVKERKERKERKEYRAIYSTGNNFGWVKYYSEYRNNSKKNREEAIREIKRQRGKDYEIICTRLYK